MDHLDKAVRQLGREANEKAAFVRLTQNALHEVALGHAEITPDLEDTIFQRMISTIVWVEDAKKRTELTRQASLALRNVLLEKELATDE